MGFSRIPIKASCFLFLVFLFSFSFPLVYSIGYFRGVGHFLDNYYYLFILFLLCFFFLFHARIKYDFLSFFISVLFFVFVFNVGWDYRSILFVSLALFLSLIPIFYVEEVKWFRLIFFVYYLISFFLIWDSDYYIDGGLRFSGFSLSPTHFAMYILCSFSFLILSEKNRYVAFVVFVSSAIFIYLSGSRLSFVLFAVFCFVIFFNLIDTKKKRAFFSFVGFFCFLFIYILYGYFFGLDGISSFGRYEDGNDKSFFSRMIFSDSILENIYELPLDKLIFGDGSGSAREIIIKKFGYDYFPHNDFLRILNDFGILGFLLFFIIFLILCSRTKLSFLAGFIYISGFYNNTIYSYYFLFFIFYSIIFFKGDDCEDSSDRSGVFRGHSC